MEFASFDDFVKKTCEDEPVDSVKALRAAGDALFIEYKRMQRELNAEHALVVKLRCERQEVDTMKDAAMARFKSAREDLSAEKKQTATLEAEVGRLRKQVEQIESDNASFEERLGALVEEKLLAQKEHTEADTPPQQSVAPSANTSIGASSHASSGHPGDSLLRMRGALNQAYLQTPSVQLALPDHTDMEADEVLLIIKSALHSVRDVTACLDKAVQKPQHLNDLSLRKAQEEAVFLLMLMSQLHAMFSYCNDMAFGITDTPAFIKSQDARTQLTIKQRSALLSDSMKLSKLYGSLTARAKSVIGKLRDVMRKGNQSGPLSNTSVAKRDSMVVAAPAAHTAEAPPSRGSTPQEPGRPLPSDDYFAVE
eukprot:TRINITY_DN36515_c0_g1_i1.p1 TRINITY_DN36515_c0_g1~~TRINITY_DN36515_c0_g1_i1.p1  ORF type:complete len:367 (+),score=83.78 TRINITY_DN36515_c0_g1_i1:216-1316(+)